MNRYVFVPISSLVICLTYVLSLHAVDNSLSKEDMQYIPLYLRGLEPLPLPRTFSEEVNFIRSVQLSVLTVAPRHEGLAPFRKREPKDLYETRTGLCFDRSRVIEKILRYSGFRTRHISLYTMSDPESELDALLNSRSYSHAVTEVWTTRGWMVVDSNAPWVAIDTNDHPLSLEAIQSSAANATPIKWHDDPPSNIYLKPFAYVIGLYSRHGTFYPPYTRIPDINYAEFFQNAL